MKCFQFVIPCEHEWAKFLQDVLERAFLPDYVRGFSIPFRTFLSLRLFSTSFFFLGRHLFPPENLQAQRMAAGNATCQVHSDRRRGYVARFALYGTVVFICAKCLISKYCALFSQSVCTCSCKIFAITTLTGWY